MIKIKNPNVVLCNNNPTSKRQEEQESEGNLGYLRACPKTGKTKGWCDDSVDKGTSSNDLNSIPGAHMVEGEIQP